MNEKLQDIVDKSCKLFTKFGIKSISMDDIAKGCGISKKTLYEYIKDKRELVEYVLQGEFSHSSHAPHAVGMENLNAVDALFKVYQSAIEFFKDFNLSMEYDLEKYYPDLYIQAKAKRRKRLYQKLLLNIEQGQKEGAYRSNFNIDIIVKLHVLKIETLLMTDIFDDDDYSSVEIFKELFLYHFYAIATEEGRIALEKKINEIN